MKYALREALRRDGKTHRPPGGVELDPKEDAAEIARLTRKGVIGGPVAEDGEGDPGGEKPEGGQQADAKEGAKDGDQAETAKADDATPEQDGASAAKESGAEAGGEAEAKPTARKTASKTKAKE